MGKMKNFNLQLFGESEDVAVDVVRELCRDYKKMSKDDAIKVAELSQLTRLADALEGINNKLESISNSVELLEKLSDCVYECRESNFLCITGDITTK